MVSSSHKNQIINGVKEFLKDGYACIMCVARKKLIRITPEEIFRQKTMTKQRQYDKN